MQWNTTEKIKMLGGGFFFPFALAMQASQLKFESFQFYALKMLIGGLLKTPVML